MRVEGIEVRKTNTEGIPILNDELLRLYSRDSNGGHEAAL
jgi:hypothetical protein